MAFVKPAVKVDSGISENSGLAQISALMLGGKAPLSIFPVGRIAAGAENLSGMGRSAASFQIIAAAISAILLTHA